MIKRRLLPILLERLQQVPAVVLLGPRQVGKTTLALEVHEKIGALYIDLESEDGRAKMIYPTEFLKNHTDKLVILDEIHRSPGLFPVLRGFIDRARRRGRKHGLYLLLGFASLEMLKQSGETLAGRVSYMELHPFNILEMKSVPGDNIRDRLWVRGGFPESFLASTDESSMRWRRDFIRTYLERDIPQFGPRIAAETLHRFWTMLAHLQGGLLNAAQLARNLGVSTKTASGYIALLTDLLLLRRLNPWHTNVKKRLVKSPKIYIRDSGILHTLLGIVNRDALLAHPVVGPSWEGFVIENIITSAPDEVRGYFYRTAGGAEVDLLLHFPGDRLWAIEIKRALSPRPRRGFHAACADLKPERSFVVYPGKDCFPVGDGIQAVSLIHLCRLITSEPHP